MSSARIPDGMRMHFIDAAGTHALRLLVLRPGGTLAECRWPIDEADDAFHLAVDLGAERICVASFQPAQHPSIEAVAPCQLRGMATHPAYRGAGAGRMLMEAALAHLRTIGSDVLWCNARLVAVPFYQRLHFAVIGPSFNIAGIGPHHLMWCSV